ncbi:Zinc finger and SCAN domain-containing [Argiope bruennichi]|uniref:Zinc finger and SCAN domain-containing n=1 Tax=Argiope bruennichi TaxID=94029 RepID=A0A8T0EFQ2_ARGBR|nr:Zinc finger and SCAN domain-containing [Argiope bruennichi]
MPSNKVSQKCLEKNEKLESIPRKVSQRLLERKIAKENSEKLLKEASQKNSIKTSEKHLGVSSTTIPPKTSKKTGKKKASISLKMPPQKCSTKRSKKAPWKSLDTNAKIVTSISQENSETHTKAVVKRQSNATCVICKRSFTSKKMLKDHNIKHHYIRHCPNCPKTFRQTRKFILHLRSHLNDYPYQCKICLEEFNQKKYLLEHKQRHISSENLKCRTCSKVFHHINSFSAHRQTHRGPPYPCTYCNAIFSNFYDRNVHCKNHVNRCILCRHKVAAFPTNLDLSFHMRLVHRDDVANDDTAHTFEACVSTGAVNLEQDSDSDSMDDMDSDDESLADMDYNYQKDAVEPVYTLKRKDKFICFICYDLYPSPELLKSHMKAHYWFPCNLCPQFFPNPETFHSHKCDFADVNCSTEIECKNCEKTVANEATSHTLANTGSVDLEEGSDRESMNDLLSSDSESLADIYLNYQKMLFQNHKCDFADVNCSTEIECENCKKTHCKMTYDTSGIIMNTPQSIVSKVQTMKYDIVQLINFIEYVKCQKLPLDVATLNRVGLHSTSLRIILKDSRIRHFFSSECISEMEDMYSKLQDFNQSLCDSINNTSE